MATSSSKQFTEDSDLHIYHLPRPKKLYYQWIWYISIKEHTLKFTVPCLTLRRHSMNISVFLSFLLILILLPWNSSIYYYPQFKGRIENYFLTQIRPWKFRPPSNDERIHIQKTDFPPPFLGSRCFSGYRKRLNCFSSWQCTEVLVLCDWEKANLKNLCCSKRRCSKGPKTDINS